LPPETGSWLLSAGGRKVELDEVDGVQDKRTSLDRSMRGSTAIGFIFVVFTEVVILPEEYSRFPDSYY
jgi:hypothetical protein